MGREDTGDVEVDGDGGGGDAHRGRCRWADLPEDMLGDVLRRLPSFADRARFRGVCRTWSAAWVRQPHPPMPWLAVPGHCISLPDGAIHRLELPSEAARCVGSFGDWLALVTNKEPSSGSVSPFLVNPFSRARIPLPPWTEKERIRKIVLSSAPGSRSCVVAAMVDCVIPGEENRKRTYYEKIKNRRRIAVCRPGDGEGAWWPVSQAFHLQDIIFYDGKLHALPPCDQLVVFDDRELDLLRREPWRVQEQQLPPPAAKIDEDDTRRYLLECKGRLLTVIRYLRGRYLTVEFEVHAFARTKEMPATAKDRWVPVKGFGGRALYVGDVCSGSFHAASDKGADEDGVKENEICFIDEALWINFKMNKRSWRDLVYGHPRRMLREVESYSILGRNHRVYRPGEFSARTGRWHCEWVSPWPDLEVRRFPPAATPGRTKTCPWSSETDQPSTWCTELMR